MTAVANERTAYTNVYAESTSMDGLIAKSGINQINRQEQGAEPMEVDSLNKLERDKTKMKCFHCQKPGHLIKDCRSRLNKLKNNKKARVMKARDHLQTLPVTNVTKRATLPETVGALKQ